MALKGLTDKLKELRAWNMQLHDLTPEQVNGLYPQLKQYLRSFQATIVSSDNAEHAIKGEKKSLLFYQTDSSDQEHKFNHLAYTNIRDIVAREIGYLTHRKPYVADSHRTTDLYASIHPEKPIIQDSVDILLTRLKVYKDITDVKDIKMDFTRIPGRKFYLEEVDDGYAIMSRKRKPERIASLPRENITPEYKSQRHR